MKTPDPIFLSPLMSRREMVLAVIDFHAGSMLHVKTLKRSDSSARTFRFVDVLRSSHKARPQESGLLCVWDLNAPDGTGEEPAPRNVNLDDVSLVVVDTHLRYDWSGRGVLPEIFDFRGGRFRMVDPLKMYRTFEEAKTPPDAALVEGSLDGEPSIDDLF